MDNSDYIQAKRVTIVGIFFNLVIACVKFSLGIIGNSAVLIAEAFDSFSDIAATTAVLIGLKLASRPKDASHPHGHGKIESLVALFVGLAVAATGIFLIYNNVLNIYNREFVRPEYIALLGIVTAILIKIFLYRYTVKAGDKLNSPAILANAADHKADVIRLSGVFFGVLFSITGYPVLDPVFAIIVALFILKTAYSIMKDSIEDLIDAQMPDDLITEIKEQVRKCNEKFSVTEIIGRRMGPRYQVNMKVKIDPYVQAIDGIDELKKLSDCLQSEVPRLQGIDIRAEVDSKKAQEFEEKFRDFVLDVLERYKDQFDSYKNMEIHFLELQQEVHFDMYVKPKMSVKEAHDITDRIEKDICRAYKQAQVVIHIEPCV
ncbi:MAG: cation-efflux pump [bacterium]|nr:cation-efflux pump [bacterium]